MTSGINIRPAGPGDSGVLVELQRRASLHGETYRAQLLAHPDAIELEEATIAAGLVRVAWVDGRRTGFSAVRPVADGDCELDGLFVEPDAMGRGVGRALVDDVGRRARRAGASRIVVVANPQAVAFYERLGFGTGPWAETRFGPAHWMHLTLGPPAEGT